jgi:S-adenosyl methyltransferase
MVSDEWVSAEIDIEQPSSARVYDYFLGGAHNFEVDRQVAEQVLAMYPDARLMAQSNRAFLRRAVRFLVDAGIRQFLDVGSGIPTVGHVHEIAQDITAEARVVYVDIDPVAVAHSEFILAGNDRATVIQEDARRPAQIFAHPDVARMLDLEQPVAVLALAVFHFIADEEDPNGIISGLTDPLAAGSYVALSHVTRDGFGDDAQDPFRGSGIDVTPRSRRQVEALLDGLQLVDPGVVWVPRWRPTSPDDVQFAQPEASGAYAAVGRKG